MKLTNADLKWEKDHQIDPNQLDLECTLQPERFYEYAEACVEAKSKCDSAKLEMEITEANLQLDIRKNPGKYGLDKITETTVQAKVKSTEEYIVAASDYNRSKEHSSILNMKVQAMEMKRRMLEQLVTLHGQEYFAGPATPRNLVDQWAKQKRRSEDIVNKKVKLRIRKKKK